ncbi:ABC transporter substrate-binding protein [Bacillus sp. 1P02SD]|uniref:ABC transporter substrate-binding protein n=1 Tax=Bacillus sp. 1P02SD TaxID=3132264 RepID=UPI0039A0B084
MNFKLKGTTLQKLCFSAGIALLLFMLAGCGETSDPTSTKEPDSNKIDKVKVGHVGSVSDAGIYIGIEKGYFKEEGLDIETVQFDSGSKMIAPLSSGDLDVGGGAISAGLFNAINSGINVRIVADKGSTFKDFGYQAIVVDSKQIDQLKRPKDFKNKKIGILGNGTAPEAALNKWLQQDGISIDDVQVETIPLSNMGVALSTGAIDAAQMVEPALTSAVEEGFGKVLVRDDEFWPDHMIGALMYAETFAKKTDIAERFMVAYLKGIRDYDEAFVDKNEEKRKEVIDILMKHGKIEDPSIYDKMVMAGLSPNGELNLDTMEEDQEYFLSTGTQDKPLDLDKVVDTSFVEKAVEKLGRK